MADSKNIKTKIKKYIELLKKNDYHIEKAYLYGSYAKGNFHKDSDIDLLLISKDFTGNRFKDSIELMKLGHAVDSRIEPMPYRPQDFNDADPLVIEVKSTGKEIKVGV
jgi:predicted nucleotidyltransferase